MAQTWLQLVQIAGSHVVKGSLPPADITQLLISKTLGYAILTGACITKVPQISNVVSSGSAEGLSALSFELEALGLIVHTSYGYLSGLPFNTYGEAAILLAQCLLLLALVYRWSKASLARVTFVTAALTALIAAVVSGNVTQDMIRTAFDANNIVFMAARVPQIFKNFSAKSTGQLSLTTNAINTVGSLVRIFTSITEGGGAAMVRAYAISVTLNLVLVLQILAYAKNTRKQAEAAKAKKKE